MTNQHATLEFRLPSIGTMERSVVTRHAAMPDINKSVD